MCLLACDLTCGFQEAGQSLPACLWAQPCKREALRCACILPECFRSGASRGGRRVEVASVW